MDKRELQRIAGVYENMNDQEFKQLEMDIKKAMERVDQLQKTYEQQTGRRYEPFR